ncbi:hypothetical protein C0J52_15225 [Blattella germanica]|nr:hypothetical protein C0J52_15225 [Blattella germanica]
MFWDSDGVILTHCVPRGTTVTGAFYQDVLKNKFLPVLREKHGGRYEYTALEADSSAHERLELERKARERAQNACQNYLRSCPRYTLLHHLNDIGEHSFMQLIQLIM